MLKAKIDRSEFPVFGVLNYGGVGVGVNQGGGLLDPSLPPQALEWVP